jgi:hypothetical protein
VLPIPREIPLLAGAHLTPLRRRIVIVAQDVERPVDQHSGDLVVKRNAECFGGAFAYGNADGHRTDRNRRRFRPRKRLAERKRDHVGDAVVVEPIAVESPYRPFPDERDLEPSPLSLRGEDSVD